MSGAIFSVRWLPLAVLLVLLGGVGTPSPLEAAPVVYREGCEYPLQGVSVCWEATAEEETGFAPFKELHVLPVAMERNGEAAIFVDYTRMIYRQLLPSRIARRLIQEWVPAVNLEEVVKDINPAWPLTLWISPRQLRSSSAASAGVVDLDAYFLTREGQLLRNLRIRVESAPQVTVATLEQGMLSAGLLYAAVGVSALSIPEVLAIVGGAAYVAEESSPQAGRSLELMTQLAVRQIIALMDHPIEEIVVPASKPPGLKHPWLPKVFK